jgi:hypothetical protein
VLFFSRLPFLSPFFLLQQRKQTTKPIMPLDSNPLDQAAASEQEHLLSQHHRHFLNISPSVEPTAHTSTFTPTTQLVVVSDAANIPSPNLLYGTMHQQPRKESTSGLVEMTGLFGSFFRFRVRSFSFSKMISHSPFFSSVSLPPSCCPGASHYYNFLFAWCRFLGLYVNKDTHSVLLRYCYPLLMMLIFLASTAVTFYHLVSSNFTRKEHPGIFSLSNLRVFCCYGTMTVSYFFGYFYMR